MHMQSTLFTLESRRIMLEDSLHHVDIDHPDFSEKEKESFKERVRDSLRQVDKLIEGTKQSIQMLTTEENF